MRRGTMIFGLIIAAAVVIIAIGNVLQDDDSQTNSSTPEPPSGSIAISIASSNTKENWINAIVEQFNAEEHRIASGEPVFVQVTHVTSGGSQRDILEGNIQPVVWSPGDNSWVAGANEVWRDRTGQPLVAETCSSTILAPIGFAMWKPMAEALGWPDTPISWDDLVELSANSDGWASLGHPEWGQFKFGHTHPDYSNVGLLIMAALAYSTQDKVSGLTADEVYSADVVEAFRRVELNTYHYGIQSRNLIALMTQRGPEYLHAVTTSEAETLKTNAEQGDRLRFPLVFIFPASGTYWSEQPYCVLDTEWVSAEQKEASAVFLDYLLAPAQQALAIDNYLRPVDESIPLHAPFTIENGTDPRVTTTSVPALETLSSNAANAVKDVFHTTKKKATVIIVLDTSGSMEGSKIVNAVDSTISFIKRLDGEDQVYVLGLGGENPYQIGQNGKVSQVGEDLISTLSGIYASGGTPLYDSVCDAIALVDTMKTEDDARDDPRLYGIVLLSDGEDSGSQISENQMFNCLPSGESVEGVKVFTIAYGDDADQDLMQRIANRTNGKSFVGDPDQIERIYNAISAEQ